MRTLVVTLTILAGSPTMGAAQNGWDDPFPAHRVMDNLYFVGTAGLGTYLVATPEGHILINSDFDRTIPLIESGMRSLGFELEDIAIILGSHAHGDHQQGDVRLRELTGAPVMIMADDVEGWRRMQNGAEVDRVLFDGDEVTLGGTTLVAHRTPGHTPGCTSWGLELEEDGRTYQALIVCSFGVNANYRLVDNAAYPSQADDYRATFARARAMDVDVFVASHGSFYGLPEKYARLQSRRAGEPNPFIDPQGFRDYVDVQESRFQAMLERQMRERR